MSLQKPDKIYFTLKPELEDIDKLLEGNRVVITFLGSGDTLGSGGRDPVCMHIASGGGRILLDCGASSLISMRRLGLDPAGIDAVAVSHLHGGHFCGIPFLILDAQYITKRSRPLIIAGPPGIEKCINDTMEIFYPGWGDSKRDFEVEYQSLETGIPAFLSSFTIIPSLAAHSGGGVSYAYRLHCYDAVIGYSGDSKWCEGLIYAAEGSELFICESCCFDRESNSHINYKTLMSHVAELGSRRIILAHLGSDMLNRLDEVEIETAYDGMQIVL